MNEEKKHFKEMLKKDELVSLTGRIIKYFSTQEGKKKGLNYLTWIILIGAFGYMYFINQSNINAKVYKDFSLAEVKYYNGDLEGASMDLKRIIDNYSGGKYKGQVLYYMGNCAFKTKNYDEALKYYKQALDSSMQDYLKARVYASIAYCYEEKGDFEKAAEEYEKLFKKYPKLEFKAEALNDLARILRAAGKFKEAGEKYNEIIEKYPDSEYSVLARRFVGK